MTLTIQQKNYTDNVKNSNVTNPVKVSDTKVFESKILGINGEIEDTKQGDRGDCWLLTSINALRDTKWGKKSLKDAIKPDGMGGAIIELKGAIGSQKKFRISVEEIEKAKQSGKYASGDDDMVALELALEKYLKIQGAQYDKNTKGDVLKGGLGTTSVFEIISGEKNHQIFLNGEKEIQNVMNEVENHPGEYSVTVGFEQSKNKMKNRHSYQLKKIVTDSVGQKFAVLVNPWDSSKEEKIPYEDFVENIETLCVIENPDAAPNKKLMSNMDKNIQKINSINKSREILNILIYGDDEKINQMLTSTDPEELYSALTENDMKLMGSFIEAYDLKKSGWGKGKEKKELISPIVNMVLAKAQAVGVDSKKIEETSKACYKELDAIFYTDEKAIIAALYSLVSEIKAKEGKNTDIN